jgi:hypothetical protein
MQNLVIAQVIGVGLIILTLLTPQMKSRKMMLFIIMIANITSCAQFYFVNATAGLFALIITTIRSAVYWYYASKDKQAQIVVLIIFVVLQIGATALGWADGWSALTLVLILNTYGQWQTKNNVLRMCLTISSFVLGIYCFHTQAYTGALNKWLQTLSAIVAIIRYNKTKITPTPDVLD